MRPHTAWLGIGVLLLAAGFAAAEEPPLLVQDPALGRSEIAFAFAGELWSVPREGGDARRLTTGVGIETSPVFSPDGETLAFTAEYAGNLDVYTIPAGGGTPRRLTYHPGPDTAVGWTPDGKEVLFRSGRTSYSPRAEKLFAVSTEGGLPRELPLPMGVDGSFSPNGERIAYVPFWNRRVSPTAYIAWKRYRGGLAAPIWIARLSDSHIEKVPRDDSNDFNPMWSGEHVYFLSDRDGTTTIYAYDTRSKSVAKVLDDGGPDVLSASARDGVIAFGRLGSISLLEIDSGKVKTVPIRIAGDFAETQPRFEKVADQVRSASLSPRGKRVAFGARGEVLTLPAEKGDARNLTNTPGTAERDPAWSPDGKSIAYFSDASGEYTLHIAPHDGRGEVRTLELGSPPSFFYSPTWSPDSKKIAYTDKRLNLWYVDLESGKPVKVDADTYDAPMRTLDPVWSPDGKWLAYTKTLDNHLRAVLIHDLAEGKSHQVTDGLSDARFAAFDKGGKYLYFTASTDIGPTAGWLDMSSMNRPVTRSVYVVVLDKDEPSPLAPESDEEAAKAEDAEKAKGQEDKPEDEKKDKGQEDKGKDEKKADEPPKVKIDLDGIDQRILALPIPPRDYVGLTVGKPGIVFLLEQPPATPNAQDEEGPASPLTVHKFELKTRKAEPFVEKVRGFEVAHEGDKALYARGQDAFLVDTGERPAEGKGKLKMETLEVRVDPRAEWRQMYREVWRIQRDFLYDPGAHGLDLDAARRAYEPFLEGVASRSDLSYLFNDMLGEIVLGHTYIAGGQRPEPRRVEGGLLGADYAVENGHYRFARIYRGEGWNPDLKAPLTQPGVNVAEGDYLLKVEGRELRPPRTPDEALENTAGKAVRLEVGPNPDGTGSREVTAVPIPSEVSLRNLAWIDANRRKVDELSGGKVAYIYLPDTAMGGFTRFNRYYFAQVDRQGAVVDERFNGGGSAADYIVEYLNRPLLSYWTTREGKDFTTPLGAIFGPKAMLINEFAGSGGDALPWYFRKLKIGPLVGSRTWGGLVGIYDYPRLIDGGIVTAPRLAFWNPDDGTWDVENRGVAPDVAVELDPEAVRQGRDPQLEKAVALVLEAIEKNPRPERTRPPYPNYFRGRGQPSPLGAAASAP